MTKLKRSTKLIVAVAVIISMILPLLVRSNRYYMDTLINLAIYVILGSSLNLLLGFSGQISMGQAAFFGIGAYTSTLLSMKLGIPFLPSMIGAVIVCFLLGFVFGLPSTKLNTIFLSIATVGLNRIVVLVLTNWRKLTGGATGILNIPTAAVFGKQLSKLQFYYMTLFFTLFVLLMCYRIVRSKTGRAIMAIRGNLLAAASIGINVNRYKLLLFAISAAFTAIGGALFAFNTRYIAPESFNTNLSVKILTMSIIGGMGDLTGAVIGSIIIGILPELLRDFSEYQLTIYGLLVVLVLRFMPGGVIAGIRGIISRCEQLLTGKKNPPSQAAWLALLQRRNKLCQCLKRKALLCALAA